MAIRLAGLFFAAFAVVHGIRIAKGWEVRVGDLTVAMWVSYIAMGVSVFMAAALLKSRRKKE